MDLKKKKFKTKLLSVPMEFINFVTWLYLIGWVLLKSSHVLGAEDFTYIQLILVLMLWMFLARDPSLPINTTKLLNLVNLTSICLSDDGSLTYSFYSANDIYGVHAEEIFLKKMNTLSLSLMVCFFREIACLFVDWSNRLIFNHSSREF